MADAGMERATRKMTLEPPVCQAAKKAYRMTGTCQKDTGATLNMNRKTSNDSDGYNPLDKTGIHVRKVQKIHRMHARDEGKAVSPGMPATVQRGNDEI